MADSSFDRQMSVFIADLAEQAERYHEVVVEMKKVATNVVEELTPQERKLLSAGYKNVIGAKRKSWNILSRLEQNDEVRSNEEDLRRVSEYKGKVQGEILELFGEILYIIDKHLIPSSSTANASVFYYTMRGDFWRYVAEVTTGTHRSEASEEATESYGAAMAIAEAELSRASPLRLALDLNLAVFFRSIMDDTQRACRYMKQTLNEAIPELDTLNPLAFIESNKQLGDLEDNMLQWNHELGLNMQETNSHFGND